MIRLVLLDIEGTTLPITFVRDVMVPYAAEVLPTLLDRHAEPAIATEIARIAASHPGADPLTVCRDWMARDEKAAPLKTLQGIAWQDGFEEGTLKAPLYPDVAPALRAWKEGDITLVVYSSGSAHAQKLLYGHTDEGDLTGLFRAFYDLSTGGKKEAASYAAIAADLAVPAQNILFLSDIGAELDAARSAGLQVCQLVRPQDGTQPHPGVPAAATFGDVAERFGLPA